MLLVRSEQNVGFAAGNNLGIVLATGRVLILLNSDTQVSPGTLKDLVTYLTDHPTVAVVSPRLVTATGIPQAFAFGCDPTPGYLLRRGANRLLGRGPLHEWAVSEPIEVDWVSGACMCVRRAAIDQVGLLDDRFFMYFEDNDWCLRMRQKGWSIVYNPTCQVIHLGGQSQPQRRQANRMYQQSLLYFYEKHYGPLAQLSLKIALQGYNLLPVDA